MAGTPQRPHLQRGYTVPLLRTVGESSRPSLLSTPPSATAVPPTPPLSNSPGSAESDHAADEAYFSRMASVAHAHPQSSQDPGIVGPPNHGHGSGNGGGGNSATSAGARIYTPISPTIASSPAALQTLRSTRSSPPGGPSAPMRIENTPDAYVLSANIGYGFDSSCITIAARKNNVLDIICDRWDMEKDCHHEWQVQFDRDADMKSGIHAAYERGILTVTVKRLNYTSAARPAVMRR